MNLLQNGELVQTVTLAVKSVLYFVLIAYLFKLAAFICLGSLAVTPGDKSDMSQTLQARNQYVVLSNNVNL